LIIAKGDLDFQAFIRKVWKKNILKILLILSQK